MSDQNEFEILTSVGRNRLRRRTKILCTIGPSSVKKETLCDMMLNGMDVARLNFSHGSRESYVKIISDIREVADSIDHSHFAILQDLQGPKIRVGPLENGSLSVSTGDKFKIFSTVDFDGNSERIGCTYDGFTKDVVVGKHIFIDDGKMEFKVLSKDEESCVVKTIVGGMIYPNKGINMPSMPLSSSILTEKDRENLQFGLRQKVDYVCLSFVSTAEDLMICRRLMLNKDFNPGGHVCPIIAKIERKEAVDNLVEIVKTTAKYGGGVMVARGDLAVETGYPTLPGIQKRIISQCLKYGVTVITATEMLMSMCKNPNPSRAEVCDVANAILDHSSVLMLSNETAVGDYPVRSVRMMHEIAVETDSTFSKYARKLLTMKDFEYYDKSYEVVLVGGKIIASKHQNAKCVVIFTRTGFTAQAFAAQRLSKPVFAFTSSEVTLRRLSLVWGVIPVLCSSSHVFEEEKVKKFLMETYVSEEFEWYNIDKEKDAFVFISGGGVHPGYTVRLVRFGGNEKDEEGEGEGEY